MQIVFKENVLNVGTRREREICGMAGPRYYCHYRLRLRLRLRLFCFILFYLFFFF